MSKSAIVCVSRQLWWRTVVVADRSARIRSERQGKIDGLMLRDGVMADSAKFDAKVGRETNAGTLHA